MTQERDSQSIEPRDGLRISNVDAEVPGLRIAISQLEPYSLLARTAALLTIPLLHPNTLRIEMLAHISFAHARGRKSVSRKILNRFLNRDLQKCSITRLEDPVEDVFISNVISPMGNHRVFEGLWESAGHCLQHILRILFIERTPSIIRECRRPVVGLLKVSEEIARRTGNQRYSISEGTPKGKIQIPRDDHLRSLSQSLYISANDLEALKIAPTDLEPFIADLEDGNETENDVIGLTTLERRPLLRCAEGLILTLPTSISLAIRRYVVEAAAGEDGIGEVSTQLRFLQVDRCFDDCLDRLGGKPAPSDWLPKMPDELSDVDSVLAQFDTDKYSHVILLHENVQEIMDQGFTGVAEWEKTKTCALSSYLADSARSVIRKPECRSGITILVSASLGMGTMYAIPDLPSGWYSFAISLADWEAWSWHRKATLLRLWKLKDQVKLLDKHGVKLLNVNGDFNLLAFWVEEDFSLVPPKLPINQGQAALFIPMNSVAGFRRDLMQGLDRHAVPRNEPRRWVAVQHLMPDTFFEEDRKKPIYVAPNHARRGELHGLVETSSRPWWVSVTRPPDPQQSDFAYLLWEGVLSWLVRLALQLDAKFANLPDGPVEIEIGFSRLAAFESPEDIRNATSDPIELRTSEERIKVTILPGFLKLLNKRKNIAEKELLAAIATGASRLGKADQVSDQSIELIVSTVMESEDARFVHAFEARRVKDALVDVPLPMPRFPELEDLASARVGLAFLCKGIDESTEIRGVKQCKKFLGELVDKIWNRLDGRLSDLDRRETVHRLLTNIEALDRDGIRWSTTARALVAVHEDREGVIRAANSREKDRSRASLASRTLIEMALCSCKREGKKCPSDSDLDSLIADATLLVEVAFVSDTIHHGLCEPELFVAPSGDVRSEFRYQEEVVIPFNREFFADRFAEAVERYDSYFVPDESPANRDLHELFDSVMTEAFQAEFGLSLTEFIGSVRALEGFALEKNLVIIEADSSELSSCLVQAGMKKDIARTFIQKFTLPLRERWDETPIGYRPQDWYPWRFGRRLSVVTRPLLPAGSGDDPKLMFGVGLINSFARIMIGRISAGRLTEEFFSSEKMRSWIGHVNDTQGAEFEEAVADRFKKAGWKARASIQMTELGANAELGDLDVLAWHKNSKIVWTVECKRLRMARTVSEIGEQLQRFRGEAKDELGKHVNRVKWLTDHPEAIARLVGRQASKIKMRPLVVTNTIVPMEFVKDLPMGRNKFVSASGLEDMIGSPPESQ